MFSHFSALNDHLPFPDYINQCRALIASRRKDGRIEENSPYELQPNPKITPLSCGALLIHGLLDCPFSLRDIGTALQAQGILSRAILLPGHGTVPSDLLTATHQQWIEIVRYGVSQLRKSVERIFLIGYSTGATLALYHAINDSSIAGLILLSPAIKIKAPVTAVVNSHHALKLIHPRNQWIYQENEIDYAKYHSIPFHAVRQVDNLTRLIDQRKVNYRAFTPPVMMIISREDETISYKKAQALFNVLLNPKNKMLLYARSLRSLADPRIVIRPSHYPTLHINHFSHMSIPFSPQNSHYGQAGDYIYASHPNVKKVKYGAYNAIEEQACDLLYQLGLLRFRRRELTYNPDFENMTKEIIQFISENN